MKSLYLLWRTIGEYQWREYTWWIFESIEKHKDWEWLYFCWGPQRQKGFQVKWDTEVHGPHLAKQTSYWPGLCPLLVASSLWKCKVLPSLLDDHNQHGRILSQIPLLCISKSWLINLGKWVFNTYGWPGTGASGRVDLTPNHNLEIQPLSGNSWEPPIWSTGGPICQ